MKNIFLILILLLLGAATWYFVWGEKFAAVEPYDTLFKLPDAEERTTRIEILDADGVSINLEKSKETDNWFCNDYYLAREDAVNKILELVGDWKMDKPLSESGIANIKDDLLQSGKQVKYFYDYNHKEPVKHYYIKGTPPSRKGAYMILEGAQKPYIVSTPRIIGSPEIMFHTILEKWRTHRIFGGNGTQVQKLSVEYPEDASKSFAILKEQNSDKLTLQTPVQAKCPNNEPPNQLAMKVLLDQAVKLNVESFDNTYSKKDSILSTPIFCTINIESTLEKLSQQINLYRMPIHGKSKLLNMPEGETQIYDVERFYASMNKNKDFVVIQAFAFETILNKNCESFYKKQ